MAIYAFAMLLLSSGSADARIVTITFTNAYGPPLVTNIFEVQPTEIMRGLSVMGGDTTFVYFIKNGIQFPFAKETVVCGPATLRIGANIQTPRLRRLKSGLRVWRGNVQHLFS